MLLVLLSNFSMEFDDKSIFLSETRPKNASVGIVSMAFFDKFRVRSCSNPSKAFLLFKQKIIKKINRSSKNCLPDVADLIVVEINFEDDWKLAECGLGQFFDFIAL